MNRSFSLTVGNDTWAIVSYINPVEDDFEWGVKVIGPVMAIEAFVLAGYERAPISIAQLLSDGDQDAASVGGTETEWAEAYRMTAGNEAEIVSIIDNVKLGAEDLDELNGLPGPDETDDCSDEYEDDSAEYHEFAELWLVGQIREDGNWSFCGIFEDECNAVKQAADENLFVVPVYLNYILPVHVGEWENLYFPYQPCDHEEV